MATVAGDRRFDVAAFIDARPIGGREIAMLVISSVILFIDGFDMYFLGKIAPAVARGLRRNTSDPSTPTTIAATAAISSIDCGTARMLCDRRSQRAAKSMAAI